jgi:hypothetical protein
VVANRRGDTSTSVCFIHSNVEETQSETIEPTIDGSVANGFVSLLDILTTPLIARKVAVTAMRSTTLSRISFVAFVSQLVLQHVSYPVWAVKVNQCVAFCAKSGIPNCVSVCRFFHRTPTEGGAIAIDVEDTEDETSDTNPDGTEIEPSIEPGNDEMVGRQDVSEAPSQLPAESFSTDAPTVVPTTVPSTMPSARPHSEMPSDLPSYVPTDVPSKLPSDMPSILPTAMPSTIPSKDPTAAPISVPPTLVPTPLHSTINDPTSSIEITNSSTAVVDTPEETTSQLEIPACNFDKKVSYQCGDDTFVCNTDQYFTALEVCNVQPVPTGGSLYDWKDLETCHQDDDEVVKALNVSHDKLDQGCWCQELQKGVSTYKNVAQRSLFPPDILCPNRQYVSSYVCYFPTQGGNGFKVQQWDDTKSGSFTEECTGYQLRTSLPPIQYTLTTKNP